MCRHHRSYHVISQFIYLHYFLVIGVAFLHKITVAVWILVPVLTEYNCKRIIAELEKIPMFICWWAYAEMLVITFNGLLVWHTSHVCLLWQYVVSQVFKHWSFRWNCLINVLLAFMCEMYLHVFICLPCTANSMFYFSHLNISCCKLSFCQTWFVHILSMILKFSDWIVICCWSTYLPVYLSVHPHPIPPHLPTRPSLGVLL